MAGSQESLSFSRFGSMASLSEPLTCPLEDIKFEDERKMKIIEDLTVKFFKKAYKIKEKSFSTVLLELERPLMPKAFNFDVINLSDRTSGNFEGFQKSFGEEINRKETINYATILAEKYKLADAISPSTPGKVEIKSHSSENGKSPNSMKIDYQIAEFIATEKNYLQELKTIDKIFISFLKNDDSGKFILKIKDFKDIFDGVVEFIPIHEKLLSNLSKGDGIDSFLSALNELIESKCLYSYQSYFTSIERRMSSFKSCLKNYPKFAQYHEDCVNKILELNKKGLDQLFIAPIQRIPRYNLILKDMLKYVKDSNNYESLKIILDEVGKLVKFLDTTKHKAEQMEKLFYMQRKINNFPPDFLRAERSFLTKIACYMVDSVDGKVSKTRLTVYLCNDMIIFAKKRPFSSGQITHDFVLAIGIKHIQIQALRSKNAEKMNFIAEIDMEHTNFTHNISDLDSTLFNRKKRSANENGLVSSSFQFSPKNQKRLSGFLIEFSESKNQFLLSESPAKLFLRQDEKRDIFFHVFDTKDQIQWENKSQILIVYVEDDLDLKEHYQFLSHYSAVAVVQGGRSNTFRYIVGTRNSHFSNLEDWSLESCPDLVDIRTFGNNFYKTILNAHLLISLYPPYSKTVNQQRRFVLESAVIESKYGSFSSISKSTGIKGFFAGLTGSSDKSNCDKLSRGSSLKNGSSPLSSPSKLLSNTRAEELKREIQIESSMSLLHL